MTRAGPISAERLKSFVDRYEKLEEERAAVNGDMRDILTEAKGVGYDAPTIRWLVKERKVDAAARDERDQLRDVYAHALGMAVNLVEVEGLSLRKAAKKTGLSKSSIHRALTVPKPSQQAGSGTRSATVVATTDAATTQDAAGRTPGEGEDDDNDSDNHDGRGRQQERVEHHHRRDGAEACPAQFQPGDEGGRPRRTSGGRHEGALRGADPAHDRPARRPVVDRRSEAGGLDRHHAVRGAADAGREGELRPGLTPEPAVSVTPEPPTFDPDRDMPAHLRRKIAHPHEGRAEE